nr:hypothetical protein GCM10020093_017410 [Planobispora longispora]
MPRQTREQIDEEIIDCAAMLFARHGFQETSIQRVADAVGYSKSGLLRHYPSKEALQEEVAARCLSELQDITRQAAGHAPGPERDRAALTALARLALRRRASSRCCCRSCSATCRTARTIPAAAGAPRWSPWPR